MNKTTGFAAFHVAFFLLMWLSKTVHVLYFEESQAVVNFGISYSAMALAGYFSFFMGHAADVWGFRRMIAFGAVLYGIGLTLRIFPHSMAIAIGSGVIAGVGASTVLSSMRLWMLALADEASKVRMVGLKSSCTALGTAIGCAAVGFLPLTSEQILLASGLGMFLLSLVFVWKSARTEQAAVRGPVRSPWNGLSDLFIRHRRLALTTTILGMTTGLYVSFIGPYLPILLKDKGLSLSAIGLSTGAFALLRFFADPWIAKFIGRHKNQSLWIFAGAELMIALVTASFLFPISKTGAVLLLLLRSLSLGFSAMTEELLWLRIFPKESVGLFFGLNQSAFFIGDFTGGLMNGYVYKHFGLDSSIHVIMAIMLVNAGLFFRLLSRPVAAGNADEAAVQVC